ncbi:hypothetical protein JL107_04205 [Nakamurella flavida]|uniref:Four-carbon acid sugar kinase family protein n=1 Tax=Nakamurella flavida TaxID=363630 RepID=A0A938YIB8_9ACTN|nr:four-carbon acid sugar kinase family protein [Nakamurella flavida]MBM9475644.1 hypothetical protein [Nakamurella flavida]MDP9778080.1 uncharacterized protein YgbK (DUF1537 family) [Nakamurella flavida]
MSVPPVPHREPVTLAELTRDLPPGRPVDPADLAATVATARRLVVLDDDPTGTQSIADLPVLTTWSVQDLRWALQQDTAGFFVLTNSRSLTPEDAADRNREIVHALAEAAAAEGVQYAIASRSDSTLRGHFPLETDVLAAELAGLGSPVDGVLVVPAYLEPGRITIDSVHWTRTAEGMVPVAQSEFARDATFGYHESDLRSWVQEKTDNRIAAGDVAAITLDHLRVGGPDRVQEVLGALTGGVPVVVDAVTDDDLRVLVQAVVAAEARGRTFLYRVGPSFVRARAGQQARPAIDAERLHAIVRDARQAAERTPEPQDPRPAAPHGLIVVGSHVGLTTRQLDALRSRGHIVELELEVPTLLDEQTAPAHLADIVDRAVELLADASSADDVVIRTSRTLVTGRDAQHSLHISRTVSAASVAVVRAIAARIRPAFVVAKGGITSSDTAALGLSVVRAWSRGTLLPGIVSLWEPVAGPAQGIPYVVFAGNVGDDDALVDVLDTLRTLSPGSPA